MFIVAPLASVLTAVIVWTMAVRRTRSQTARLECQLGELKERMQRTSATLACADVRAFELVIGPNRVRPALGDAADTLAQVDFLGNPPEFLRQVHPEDASRLEDELKTLTLQDGARHLAYRFTDGAGQESEVRVVTRLIRDALNRPILISGALLADAASQATAQHASRQPDEHGDDSRTQQGMVPEWESFAPEQAVSPPLEGELVELSPPRMRVVR
jgi:hypothetical protein